MLLRCSLMLHVAIIMDGNGRWAAARRLPRLAGHRQGAQAVRHIVEAAPSFGITDLTVYAFSSDNWRRPPAETSGLMTLLAGFLDAETPRCLRNGVRVSAIGRRDRLPASTLRALSAAEHATRDQRRLHFRVALDYSSRDALLDAALGGAQTREEFAARLTPDVDLLIRTAGEQRLSDFLLWECAYAEFFFSSRLWPDFGPSDLEEALRAFRLRERRFGGLPQGYCELPA